MSKPVSNNLTLFLKEHYKWLIGILLIYLIGIVALYSTTLPADIKTMEANLMNLDLARSSLLFILDNLIIIFVIFSPFLIIGNIYLYFDLKKLKKMATVSLIILLIVLQPINLLAHQNKNMSTLQEPSTPLAKIVFVITFDGARADTFWNYADFIVKHKDEATWAKKIVVTYPTVTYPNHVSLFTGTWPQIHLTQNNPSSPDFGTRRYASTLLRGYHKPVVENIFQIAERYGYLTALFSAPSSLANILKASDTYVVTGFESIKMMSEVLDYLSSNINEIKNKGLLAFIHLVDTDEAMHSHGTDSPEYKLAMRRNAEQVGRLYNKTFDLGIQDDTVIIVTADHGGIERGHYNRWPPSVAEVALWMWGKPFKKGHQLGGARIVDIAPTVSYILGIPKPDKCIGVTLYTALNETVINEKRGISLDLINMEKNEIRKAFNVLLAETVTLYFINITAVLGLVILSILLLRQNKERKKLKREIKAP